MAVRIDGKHGHPDQRSAVRILVPLPDASDAVRLPAGQADPMPNVPAGLVARLVNPRGRYEASLPVSPSFAIETRRTDRFRSSVHRVKRPFLPPVPVSPLGLHELRPETEHRLDRLSIATRRADDRRSIVRVDVLIPRVAPVQVTDPELQLADTRILVWRSVVCAHCPPQILRLDAIILLRDTLYIHTASSAHHDLAPL